MKNNTGTIMSDNIMCSSSRAERFALPEHMPPEQQKRMEDFDAAMHACIEEYMQEHPGEYIIGSEAIACSVFRADRLAYCKDQRIEDPENSSGQPQKQDA